MANLTKKCDQCCMDIPWGASRCPYCQTDEPGQPKEIRAKWALSIFGLSVVIAVFPTISFLGESSAMDSRAYVFAFIVICGGISSILSLIGLALFGLISRIFENEDED